ncbi:MAG: hypothetical protein LBJ02_12005 [Bifidobacteriaceae bacterium]|jgi:hypothetical protein|nr:hypothetical protein [Bifidobacteriaceae bacterium]
MTAAQDLPPSVGFPLSPPEPWVRLLEEEAELSSLVFAEQCRRLRQRYWGQGRGDAPDLMSRNSKTGEARSEATALLGACRIYTEKYLSAGKRAIKEARRHVLAHAERSLIDELGDGRELSAESAKIMRWIDNADSGDLGGLAGLRGSSFGHDFRAAVVDGLLDQMDWLVGSTKEKMAKRHGQELANGVDRSLVGGAVILAADSLHKLWVLSFENVMTVVLGIAGLNYLGWYVKQLKKQPKERLVSPDAFGVGSAGGSDAGTSDDQRVNADSWALRDSGAFTSPSETMAEHLAMTEVADGGLAVLFRQWAKSPEAVFRHLQLTESARVLAVAVLEAMADGSDLPALPRHRPAKRDPYEAQMWRLARTVIDAYEGPGQSREALNRLWREQAQPSVQLFSYVVIGLGPDDVRDDAAALQRAIRAVDGAWGGLSGRAGTHGATRRWQVLRLAAQAAKVTTRGARVSKEDFKVLAEQELNKPSNPNHPGPGDALRRLGYADDPVAGLHEIESEAAKAMGQPRPQCVLWSDPCPAHNPAKRNGE